MKNIEFMLHLGDYSRFDVREYPDSMPERRIQDDLEIWKEEQIEYYWRELPETGCYRR